MDRRLLLLVAILAVAAAPWTIPEARADRLGGNYRSPDDRYVIREDPPLSTQSLAVRDPLLASFGLGPPFRSGVEAGREEARFRGRPLLVFFVLPGCDLCASVAERAFRDAEVLDLAARFVPVLADAEKEESFGIAHRVKSFPTILLLDASGRETGRAEGAVDAARAAAALREGLRKAGPARPTPEARALEKSATLLAQARKADDWRALLGAAAAIEKVGHDGPELEEARAARSEAAREAASRLDAARRLIRVGGKDDPRVVLARIAREFEGLEESVEAADLVRGLVGSRPAGTGPGGRALTMAARDPSARDPRLTLRVVAPVPNPVQVPANPSPVEIDSGLLERPYEVPEPPPPPDD